MIPEGKKAPDFTLKDQDGRDVSLADFAGCTLVLYFYPRADTPGCTTQACGVRDHLGESVAQRDRNGFTLRLELRDQLLRVRGAERGSRCAPRARTLRLSFEP